MKVVLTLFLGAYPEYLLESDVHFGFCSYTDFAGVLVVWLERSLEDLVSLNVSHGEFRELRDA